MSPPPGGHYRPLQGPPEPSLDSYVRELYACGELGVLHKRITKREGFTWYPLSHATTPPTQHCLKLKKKLIGFPPFCQNKPVWRAVD